MEAGPEEHERDGNEDRLVRRERRQVADPGATEPEAEQDERHDAAGRRGKGAQHAAGGKPSLPAFRLRG
jgi:hypothetical protein